MVLIFGVWGINAFQKYLSQPMVTDITTRVGDDGTYIQFPQITICNYRFLKENSYLKDCLDATGSYLKTLENCMKVKKNFNVKDFLASLTYNQTHFIKKATLRMQEFAPRMDLEKFSAKIWTPVFHKSFGLCYALYLSGETAYKNLPIEDKPYLRLHFSNDNPWTWAVIMVHSKHDLPDALIMQPATFINLKQVKCFKIKGYFLFVPNHPWSFRPPGPPQLSSAWA